MLDLTRAKKVLTDENERLRAEITAKEKLIASNEKAIEYIENLQRQEKEKK